MQILECSKYLGNNGKTFTANGVWIGITEYRKENLPNFSWHAHANDHISLLLKGGTVIKSANREQVGTSGDVIFFHSDEAHQNSHTPVGSKNLNIEFEDEFLKTFDLQISGLKRSLTTINSKFILLKIFKELQSSDSLSPDSITLLVLSLFGNHQLTKTSYVPGWIATAREYLHDNSTRHISLVELSHLTGAHPVTISKYFPKHFSCTLGEYMRHLKAEKALKLLQNREVSLSNVAYECGFSDQSHFIRTFKNLTGILPGEYFKLINS